MSFPLTCSLLTSHPSFNPFATATGLGSTAIGAISTLLGTFFRTLYKRQTFLDNFVYFSYEQFVVVLAVRVGSVMLFLQPGFSVIWSL